MAERDLAKEVDEYRESLRRAHTQLDRMKNAVKIAARMDKPTEQEVNQLIYMAEDVR